eukprot:5726683-Pyramimonas_sp.AAC.1
MLSSGLRARMSTSFGRPCALAVARILCNRWGEVRARVVARACRNPSPSSFSQRFQIRVSKTHTQIHGFATSVFTKLA